MKLKIVVLSLLLSALTSNAYAKSNDYKWIVRARGLYVTTSATSKVSVIGGNVATSSDFVPELDFTRFFTPNIAAELILGTTKHDVALYNSALGAKAGLGSVKLLPPTLTMQYHVNPAGKIRPYFGAGLNYTFFYGAKTGGAATSLKYHDHLGYALQAGFDYMINDRLGINFDIKKIYLKTSVTVNGVVNADVRLDPWLFGAGVSYRF